MTADGVTRDMVYYDLHAEIPENQGIFTYNNTYTLSVTKPENGESAAECKNKTLYKMKYRTFARPTTNTSYGFKQIAYYDSAKRLGSLYTEGDGIKTHEWFVYDKNRIMESNPSPSQAQKAAP